MSFQQGVSGLTASARNLEVIGNNVANASTVGAKVSRAEFADVYARAISGGASAIGLGVSQTAVTQQFSQGSFRSTDNPLDMAINGGGFFQLKDMSGSLQYTRNGQFLQMQALQGASLVGRDVILKGDKLSVPAGGVPQGTFELGAAADHVKVDVLSPAGMVVDSINLGAQTSGRHDFSWPAGGKVSESAGYRFRVTALSGATTLATTTLMRDKVSAVNTGGASLTLELARSGNVAYSAIESLN